MTKTHFIKKIIQEDIKNKKLTTLVTRFPPEPNGFLHLGHAKSIHLNFSLAQEFNGRCHLRFDDTNPDTEEQIFIDAIKEDVQWLGHSWKEYEFYASDYFDRLFDIALTLIEKNLAYVCDLSLEEIKQNRGTLNAPGIESPYRARTRDENKALFLQMKEGKFLPGTKVLRAKIDMNHPNLNLRDPVLYRIKNTHHHRTKEKWCLYPMYDYTHALSDAFEGITHSLCTLEFEDHRPLYDWFISHQMHGTHKPRQIEFARLNLEYHVMSKRILKKLVEEKRVSGWDDPRMPTLKGLRKLGITKEIILHFCEAIGLTKKDSVIELETFYNLTRDFFDKNAVRVMGVLNPVKVELINWPSEKEMAIIALNHPKNKDFGEREIILTKELYIEKTDFERNSDESFHRLTPLQRVRLRFGPIIELVEEVLDENQETLLLKCRFIEDSFAGAIPLSIEKPKGIIHWVSASHCLWAKANLYLPLFKDPQPNLDLPLASLLRDDSLVEIPSFPLEKNYLSVCEKNPSVKHVQLERVGNFFLDEDSCLSSSNIILNRVVPLKDKFKEKQPKKEN